MKEIIPEHRSQASTCTPSGPSAKQTKTIICIVCPKGCEAQVLQKEETIEIKGKICKKGREYITQEFVEPMRTLTSTVVVKNSRMKRLPVRTSGPIPKKDLFRAVDVLSPVAVRPPIRIGDVILPDLLGTGIKVIASDDLLE